MDEEDEGSKFCEEDIDQILQRRTQTITIQSEGKGSTFAKVAAAHLPFRLDLGTDFASNLSGFVPFFPQASFISSGNRTDISLDDPNFWQKWAKIAEVEIDSKSEKVERDGAEGGAKRALLRRERGRGCPCGGSSSGPTSSLPPRRSLW